MLQRKQVGENFLKSLDKGHWITIFDIKQGKSERIQDYIFREEILTVGLQEDTAIDLDEKIRGYRLITTSNLAEREVSKIKSSLRYRDSSRKSEKSHHPDDCCKET